MNENKEVISRTTDYRSYLLRLWRNDSATCCDWHASLEDPRTGERFGFASLEELFAFLMQVGGGIRAG